MRNLRVLIAVLGLAVLCTAAGSSRVQAQSTVSMTCGQVAGGTSATCGTLTISSGSMYPEILDQIIASNGAFSVSSGCTGMYLISNSCSVTVSFTAGATVGAVTGAILISYRTCAYDVNGNPTCGSSAESSKSVSISATVLAPGSPPVTTPSDPVTVPAVPASTGPGDYSYLSACRVNLALQQFCIVVPIN